MEVLQSIWTALTTENEVLTNILLIPYNFIEAYILMLLFITILNINTSRKNKIIYIFSVGIVSIISRYLIPNPYNTYFNLIYIFISIRLTFKTSILKSISALIIPFLIEIITELIFSKLYYYIFNINYEIGFTIPLHRLIGTFLIYIILYFIYILLKNYKINISKFEVTNKKRRLLLSLNVVLAIILVSTELYIIILYSSYLPIYILLLTTFSLISYFFVSFYTIFATSKLENATISLEQANQHNKTLELLQDNTRAFRHDMTNILLGMSGYIDNEDINGLKKYYNQLLSDIKQTNNLTTLSPKIVNNPAIYNILANKYHKADSLGIKINLEVFIDLNEIKIKIYEFTRVLGILMDNAIESSSECDEKIINVTIRKNNKKHMQYLLIENTYKEKEIDINKIFDKGFSTKKDNTGLGLWEIRQILKKNNNLNLYTTKNDKYFIQQFEIYY